MLPEAAPVQLPFLRFDPTQTCCWAVRSLAESGEMHSSPLYTMPAYSRLTDPT